MSDDKIDALANGLDALSQRMEAMGKGLRTEMREMQETHELRLEMRAGFSEVNSRMDRVEKKVDGITTFLVASEKATEKLTDRVTRLERPKKNS